MAKQPEGGEPPLQFSDSKSLEAWLNTQKREVAVAIAARAALRVAPRAAGWVPYAKEKDRTRRFLNLTSAIFRATALARVASTFPTRANELLAAADNATENAAAYAALPADAAAAATAAVRAAADNVANNAAARAAAYAADTVAAIEATGFGSRFSAAIWAEVSADASALARGESLASTPLWTLARPDWSREHWERLKAALPEDENWRVWIDWYEDRIIGRAYGEAKEFIFAQVPEAEWEKGPAAANKWIADRLAELEPKLPPLPQPVANVPSLFTFGENAAGQIGIVAGPQNMPVFPFPGDDETHRQWLDAARQLTERLAADLRAKKFGNAVRSDYLEGLERYASDLPSAPGAGNFLLADDEARTLRDLFAAEARVLPDAFAARLNRVLERQFALRGFYPELERYFSAIQKGQLDAPLPQEAVEGFGKIVRENTPRAFLPEVSQGLREAERQPPKVELEPEDIRAAPAAITPPSDPYGELDPKQSRSFGIAGSINALYQAVLDATKNPEKAAAWIFIAEELGKYAGPIIEWLKAVNGL